MLYADDEGRHDYHKAPVLLQVVCQVLEAHFASAGVQLQLVDCERNAGMWLAAIAVASNIHEDTMNDIVDKTNKAFLRTDEIETVQVENAEIGLMSIRVTEPSDFSQLL